MGDTFVSLTDYAQAQTQFEAALPLFQAQLGKEDPKSLRVITSLVGVYALRGKYREAEAIGTEALEVLRRVRGSEHPETLKLNDGLRPHLQRWQGKFRRWQTAGGDLAQAAGLAPQEAQKLFPSWAALHDDLLAANQRLIGYLAALDAIVARPNAAQSRPAKKKRTCL